MIPHSTSKPIYELAIGWNLLGKGIIVLTPRYPIALGQSNLLMVVSVVTAIDNILMDHTDFKNLARQLKQLSRNVNSADYC
jgi:hypothetical protein